MKAIFNMIVLVAMLCILQPAVSAREMTVNDQKAVTAVQPADSYYSSYPQRIESGSVILHPYGYYCELSQSSDYWLFHVLCRLHAAGHEDDFEFFDRTFNNNSSQDQP